MPLPADSILIALCGRIAYRPLLVHTDHDRIPVLSFKIEVAAREPAVYAPITKRLLLIGGKDPDPATDPALRAAEALAAGQRVSILGTERRREWFFDGVRMLGAQIEVAELRQLADERLVFRPGSPGDTIE